MDAASDKPIRLLIGDLVLDTGKRQLSREGAVIRLPKLSFRMLRVLAEAAPNIVNHDKLVDEVWRGRVVSPETVTQRIKLLRQALGDDANNPRYVGLVRGEGYRLLVEVQDLPGEDATITQGIVSELGRRRVLQVALVYAAIAWSITEVISFLLEALPVFPDWSKALVAIIFVVGFPVAMFLAWRFDIGPGGIKRTEAASTEGRVTITAALILLVGATAGLFYLIYPSVVDPIGDSAQPITISSIPAANTIAVLPFANASANPDDLYMSEGLGDELRDQLGRVEGLRVAARSSSVMFRDEIADAVTISDRLRVGKLIEGTLRRQGDEIRITVQIIDGQSGFQDWTQSYSRAATDLLAVQQQIAEEIVTQMLPELDATIVASSPATLNATAHELMLLARYDFQQVQEAPVVDLALLMRAIDRYQQATELDPDSALAHSRLGYALLYLGNVEAAEEPIRKALSLDADLSEVQNTLGLYYWTRFLPGSGDAHKRAVELNPNNADALEKYAKWIWHQQITDEAEPYFLRALELDPMTLQRYLDLGHFYGFSNRRDDARAIAEQIKSRFSDASAYMALGRIYELTGDLDEGIAWALKARNLSPDDPLKSWLVAELYARIGDFEAASYFEDPVSSFHILNWQRRYDEMIDLVEELVIDQPNQIQLWYGLARAHAATGRYEQAIYVLRAKGLPDNALVDSRRANGLEAFVTLADSLKETGNIDLAHEHAAWLSETFQRLADTGAGDSWWPNFYQACALSILGQYDQALTKLERVNNSDGLLWYPQLMDAPCFRRMADQPRYQAVVRSYEARMEALRERLPDTLERMQSVN